MDDLDRLFHYLVNHLAADAPGYLTRSFQVSELYQRLIPYRHHRDSMGFDSIEDYEVALLRLLSGERDYATVLPEDAQQAMAREARQPRPNPGTFREFAAATMTLSRDAIQRFTRSTTAYAPPPPRPEPPAFAPPGLIDDAASYAPPTTPAPPPQAAPPSPAPDPIPVQAPEPVVPEMVFEHVESEPACPGCAEALPEEHEVRYCPFCGLRIGVVDCQRCGSSVEPEWRYCLTCGIRIED